jgi:hypothetical protein
MRRLSSVIEQMLQVIPEEKVSLRDELLEIENFAHYIPPELDSYLYQETMNLLFDNLDNESADWKFQVLLIWRNEI